MVRTRTPLTKTNISFLSLPQASYVIWVWPCFFCDLIRVVDSHCINPDPDPAFFLIADPDPLPNPEFWWLKVAKKFIAVTLFYISGSLNCNLLILRPPDPDPLPNPGFWWPKIDKKFIAVKLFIYFLDHKIAIYLSLGLHKGCTSYRRSLKLAKEKKSSNNFFFYICGSFLPSWIRIRIQQLQLMRIHADPDLIFKTS